MTLVVIDMQPTFAACEDVAEAVVEEVYRAKARRTGIIVVEYRNCGPTHRLVQQAIRGYHRQAWVTKNDDDGGIMVAAAANLHRFWNKSWRFCGVNTCYCVDATVKSMIRIFPMAKFEYAVNAMNCDCYSETCGKYFNSKAELNKNHSIV